MSTKNDGQKVCSYEKFGFCMKREQCEDFHPTENCIDAKCSIVNCKRRHPQPCRFLELRMAADLAVPANLIIRDKCIFSQSLKRCSLKLEN